MSRSIVLAVGLLVLTTGCEWCPLCDLAPPTNTPRVVVQITETENAEALDKMVGELRARNGKAVILVNGDFAAQNCQALQALHAEGYEVMAFVRPESGTLPMLSREQQEQLIADTKAALENCLGTSVAGFRATRFDQNQDTWEIVDAHGFLYNLAFAAGRAYLPGHESDTLPYRSAEYGFWAVPMHVVANEGRVSAFCDNPFGGLPAEDWEALLKSEFDRMRAQGRPLIVEFHPYFSGVDEGRFQAFVSFLDYAVQQGAEFLTVAEYVAWAQEFCSVCEE
jgi:peptidoglycan/xylan/chitin deacetylase (PgdA/CDA1 family)